MITETLFILLDVVDKPVVVETVLLVTPVDFPI
jgi:hypothetical protein